MFFFRLSQRLTSVQADIYCATVDLSKPKAFLKLVFQQLKITHILKNICLNLKTATNNKLQAMDLNRDIERVHFGCLIILPELGEAALLDTEAEVFCVGGRDGAGVELGFDDDLLGFRVNYGDLSPVLLALLLTPQHHQLHGKDVVQLAHPENECFTTCFMYDFL